MPSRTTKGVGQYAKVSAYIEIDFQPFYQTHDALQDYNNANDWSWRAVLITIFKIKTCGSIKHI